MKLLIYFFFVFSFFEVSFASCICYPSNNVPTNIFSYTISGPTDTGTFSGQPCVTDCTTSIGFEGTMSNGLPPDVEIIFIMCSELDDFNYIVLEATNTTYTSCPTSSILVTTTNIINLHFHFSAPTQVYINMKPTVHQGAMGHRQ